MDRHIEGYCNFVNGDKLVVSGKEMAKVVQLDSDMYLDFNDDNLTRMYLGKIGDSSIDNLINVVWTTLGLKWEI